MLGDPGLAGRRDGDPERAVGDLLTPEDPDPLALIASGLRQAADTVSRLQRSLEVCLTRAERARAGTGSDGGQGTDGGRGADGGHGPDRTLHLLDGDDQDGGVAARSGLVTAMTVHGFRIDPGRHTVEVEGRRVLLTPNEWQLFALMLGHPCQTLSREELAVGAWGHGFGGRDSEVEVYISRLRRKLESDPRSPLIIETVRGAGYRLVPPEEPEPRAPADREQAAG